MWSPQRPGTNRAESQKGRTAMTATLDYIFDQLKVESAGAHPLRFTNATVVNGPGRTTAGSFPKALELKKGGARIDISSLAIDARQFHMRVVFRSPGKVTSRNNLVESAHLPFSLSLHPGADDQSYEFRADVGSQDHGWTGATNRFTRRLKNKTWYVADIAYDLDTLALFINEKLVGIAALPNGALKAPGGSDLFFGTWVDGRRNQFTGAIAAFQLNQAVPTDLERQLDERRTDPSWYISHAQNRLRGTVDLGRATEPIKLSRQTGQHQQRHERGLLSYHDSLGMAHEMHGAIHSTYQSMRSRHKLGHLLTDEIPGHAGTGRMSMFSQGGIYWTRGLGAHPVVGKMWLAYEAQGGAAGIGFPTESARRLNGGQHQRFQNGSIVYRDNDPTAHVLDGAATSAWRLSTLGWPTTSTQTVRRGVRIRGTMTEFERGAIYTFGSSTVTLASREIVEAYQDRGGPEGSLGLPTTSLRSVGGGSQKVAGFQNGVLVLNGNRVERPDPFRIRIGRVNTRESEGWLAGENDLYLRIRVLENGNEIYSVRKPGRGSYSGRNVRDIDFTIPRKLTPKVDSAYTLEVKVWDDDNAATGKDDFLGTWEKRLDASNLWGYAEGNGVFSSGAIKKIRNIDASIVPDVNAAKLSEQEKFWSLANRGTSSVNWQKYAAAFRDVDSETEWWDVGDWVHKAFHELVVDGVASGGNCFGMSLESIYSRKGRSRFPLPTNRFNSWSTLEKDFNIRQCFQVGAEPIWWFVGQFLSGNTHDPKDVFTGTRNAFNRGANPVLCVSQNYDFSGAPHCVLPIAWDSSSKPWKIDVLDPNGRGAVDTVEINPDANTFRYQRSGSSTAYSGGAWSGGRMHYMPFGVLDSTPRTPVWEAIVLLLAGTVLILGEASETTAITDNLGNDLDAHGEEAKTGLKNRRRIDDAFVRYRGFDDINNGSVASDMRFRMGRRLQTDGTAEEEPLVLTPLQPLDRFRGLPTSVADALDRLGDLASGRNAHHLANDPRVAAALNARSRAALTELTTGPSELSFRHEIADRSNGDFHYMVKHGTSEFEVTTSAKRNATSTIGSDLLGTSKQTIEIETAVSRPTSTLRSSTRLGATDSVEVIVDDLALEVGRQVKVNPQPGLGSFDIVGAPDTGQVQFTVVTTIAGREQRRRFNVDSKPGLRVDIASAVASSELAVGRIDNVFGPISDRVLLPPVG